MCRRQKRYVYVADLGPRALSYLFHSLDLSRWGSVPLGGWVHCSRGKDAPDASVRQLRMSCFLRGGSDNRSWQSGIETLIFLTQKFASIEGQAQGKSIRPGWRPLANTLRGPCRSEKARSTPCKAASFEEPNRSPQCWIFLIHYFPQKSWYYRGIVVPAASILLLSA